MAETRKLAAILVSDVVGYSRLAGSDEDRILARLRALRSDLIDPIIAVHNGRVVKRTRPNDRSQRNSRRASETETIRGPVSLRSVPGEPPSIFTAEPPSRHR